jgi:hypothetical protein
MASAHPTLSQQGVTKHLSGANASFKDKVCPFNLFRSMAQRAASRASPWNCGYRIWSLRRVRISYVLVRSSISVYLLAVSDAVRTSLGPRGMDKMVNPSRYLSLHGMLNNVSFSDPNIEGRSHRDKRWGYYLEKCTSPPPCRKNGEPPLISNTQAYLISPLIWN